MSTINVDNILAYSFIGGLVNINGTNITYNTGGSIIGIGQNALISNNGTTSINNVALGKAALQALVSGDGNTGLGGASLSSTTGNNNTAAGYFAGATNTTGTNNLFLGHSSLGSSDVANNEITLGNSANAVLRCAVTTITSLSDKRDKKEIETLPVGLDFIKGLKPVKFVWDDREETGKHDVADFGFIAQDLKESQEKVEMANILKLVYEENPEKLEASYGKLIPILVKAIQELSTEVELLKNK
jgi:hypothetical protein